MLKCVPIYRYCLSPTSSDFFLIFFFEGGRCQWAFFFKNITLSILVYLLLQSLYNTLVIIDDGQCYEQYVLPVDKKKIYMYMY